MEKLKLPKFSWGKTFEYNSGHNKNEWGIPDEDNKKESNIKFVVAYTIKGDLAHVNTEGFLASHLRTKIPAD